MKNPTLFSYALLLSIVCLTSCGVISELNDGVEENVEASTPLEVSGKSGEAELDEKTADSDLTSTETRIERSSEATSDKNDNVESKVDAEAEGNLKTAVARHEESAEIAKVDDKMSDVNDAAEEISSEKSVTGLSDAGFDKNDDLNVRTVDKDSKEINDKSVDDQIYVSRETTRSMPYDTHDMLLDQKARAAENSEENFEIQAKSDLEAVNAEAFGSRRSYSGSPGSSGFVTSGRSGQMFGDVPLSIPNPNAAMFVKIANDELIQPNTYFDPVSSSEFKSLEQFNSNPFANSYPYSFQPTTTTPSPAETNRYQEIGLVPKMVQQQDNLNKPMGRFIAENLRPFPPMPFKPYVQNLPFPVLRPYNTRFNQIPTLPARYYKKCNHCPQY